MPQINDIRELAQQNARYVSNSPQDWMSYLDVAARLYRYSFTDTLLIHAQRPDATACAELELWNQKMSRWVNRGAKGIALLDDTGPRIRLRYVFDIADTHLVRGGRTPLLWNLDSHEHEQTILDHLADTYGLSQTDSMNTALMELAQQLTADNLDEAMDGLAYEVADTFLEELDEDNIRVRFRELMTNSIFYTLSRRCGQEPMDVLDDDDFIRIVDFNKLPVLSFLGNAVSEQCEAVLFDIGREMRKIHQKEMTQQLEKSVDSLYNTNTDFSTLKRKTKDNTTKGGQENGVDVSSQGRLPVPESGREGRAADHREVRDAAQDVPEREPQELVSEYADERQAEPASGGDRGSSGESGGNPAGQPEREVSGTEQGKGPAGMGGAPEQPDGDGRRDRFEEIGVQLTETTTEQDLSEAEEEIASAFSFPDLPTVEQQIRAIEAPIQARYADEIALDPEVVDEILRTGSNRSKGQLRLIYNFMVEKTPEEYTEFVKNEYGTGGKGFEIDGAKYAVWFDDLGMRIAAGSTAKGGTIANAFLSWEDVSNRIHELLRQGEYAPQAVLDAARQNALQEHAQTLAYMERDLADGVAEAVFQDVEIFRGGFPELTDRLAGLLDDTEFLTDLNDRLSALGEAYAEDKDLISKKVWTSLQRKKEAGYAVGSDAPFGYIRNPVTKRNEIDPETAFYVQLIFQWVLMGVAIFEIARRLTLLKVPTPREWHRKIVEGKEVVTYKKWGETSVRHMLANQTYVGDTINNKSTQRFFAGQDKRDLSKEQWYVAKNTHPAIIARDDFEKVQEILTKNQKVFKTVRAESEQIRTEYQNDLAGMVFCADCGRSMDFDRLPHGAEESKKVCYYICRARQADDKCIGHQITEKLLKALVMDQLHLFIVRLSDKRKVLEELRKIEDMQNPVYRAKSEIMSLTDKVSQMAKKREQLYADYVAGVVDSEDYQLIREDYSKQYDGLRAALQRAEAKKVEVEQQIREYLNMTSNLEEHLDDFGFDAQLVKSLVQRIEVSADKRIRIVFGFQDVFADLGKESAGK